MQPTPPGAAAPGAAPGAGQPTPQQVEQERGQQLGKPDLNPPEQPDNDSVPPFEQLRDEAIRLVYGPRFDALIDMFKTNGPDKFAHSMAIAVNTPLQELEDVYGGIPYDEAAKVGLAIYMRLLDDIVGEKLMDGVSIEQIQETIPAILMMYRSWNPEVTQQDIQTVVLEAHKGIQQQGDGARFVPGVDKEKNAAPEPGDAAQVRLAPDKPVDQMPDPRVIPGREDAGGA